MPILKERVTILPLVAKVVTLCEAKKIPLSDHIKIIT